MSFDSAPWSRPALAEQVLRRRRDGRAEVALHIAALAQPRRALQLEQVLHDTAGVVSLAFDRVAQRARVVFDDARLPLPALLDACAGAGCAAQPLHRDRLADRGRALGNASLKRLLVAGVFAMQAMMFAFVLYIGAVDPLDATTAQLFRWLGLLSAIPVVGYAALPFYRDALRGLRAGRPGIDVPIALAIVFIFSASVVNALRGSGEIYFDSISMFVFVLLLGRHLQLRAHLKHRALGELAADALPLVAQRRREDGSLETVAAAELVPGDRVQVAEGEALPCDGVLESDRAQTDESLLSGESRACAHRRGDALGAGSVALGAPLELRVTREVGASATSVLAQLAARAHAARDVAGDADAPAARRFVWRVLALAVATAAYWLWRDPARAFDATVAVLVVACPCAFGLAAPAVLTRSMAVLSRHGVLVARTSALRALARADRVLFDKTGTLTGPALDSAGVQTFRDLSREDALRRAVALARESSHPVARAMARASLAWEVPLANDVEVVAGGGVRGVVEGRLLRLGHAAFADADPADDALWLADAAGPLARLPVIENLRPDAQACIGSLRDEGLDCALVSGDAPERVRAVAARLGIGQWWARQSPADKLAQVRREQAAGRVVLAVGDGGNDAAALAAADVSAVPGDAVDLARVRADLLLPGGLGGLPLARALSARAVRILAQNRRWSLIWNLGAVPFAALGFVPPWLAALGMSTSSLAVVLNSLRIRAEPDPRTPPMPLRERAA
ncbi:MAG: P-type ATPase [Rhodanobacteraceae bacterium]|jgi:Cu2+-exporting ATPase|nr:MAG: P-type ATPase [Rhodanobacteraceae bacterium]